MCSQKRLEANRRNALKSTGPRTDQGKERCSHNALKHGLTAQTPVVLDEDPAEFEALADAIRQDLRPRGAMEQILVQRIILASWKLQRSAGAEAEAVAFIRRHRDEMTCTAVVAEDIASGVSALARLQMYEMRLERSLHACLRQLAQLRKLRKSDGDDKADECPPEPCAAKELAWRSVQDPSRNTAQDDIETEASSDPTLAEMQNEPTALSLKPPDRLAG